MSQRVAVLGASTNSDRYAHKAHQRLKEHGHEVVPVALQAGEILGDPVVTSLDEIEPGTVDTLTLYLRPELSESLEQQIVDLAPGRVIMNPGAESESLRSALDAKGIPVEQACTLVLLSTGQFDPE